MSELPDKPFLAYTRKYGWIAARKADPGWSGYLTIPGQYGLQERDILAVEPLPRIPGSKP